jgi:hypothetical protein
LGLLKTSLIILSALLLTSCSETEYQQENFSLDIPDGWAVIPIEVVDELLKKNGMPEGLFQLSLTTSENLPLFLDGKAVDQPPIVNIQDIRVDNLDEQDCRKFLEKAETYSVGFSSSEYGPSKRSRTLTFLLSATEGPLAGLEIERRVKVICTITGALTINAHYRADDNSHKSDVDNILSSFSVADHYQ